MVPPGSDDVYSGRSGPQAGPGTVTRLRVRGSRWPDPAAPESSHGGRALAPADLLLLTVTAITAMTAYFYLVML